MINYESSVSREIKRINEEILKQGGQGLVPEGYIIGYDNITDTYIYYKHLNVNIITGEYVD